MAEDDEYRLEVLIELPDLVRLDKDEYTEEDKVESQDLKKRKEEEAAQKEVIKVNQCYSVLIKN